MAFDIDTNPDRSSDRGKRQRSSVTGTVTCDRCGHLTLVYYIIEPDHDKVCGSCVDHGADDVVEP